MNSITVKDAAGVDRIIAASPPYKALHLTAADPTAGGMSDVTGATGQPLIISDLQLRDGADSLGRGFLRIPIAEAGYSKCQIVVGEGGGLDTIANLILSLNGPYGDSFYMAIGPAPNGRTFIRYIDVNAKTDIVEGAFVWIALNEWSTVAATTGSIELYIYRW